MDEPPSSPPSEDTSPEDALAYYKSQYEQLELELAEFQASSQELEAELEKDVEAAEKRERVLQEKAESFGFEVEEWKVCAALWNEQGDYSDADSGRPSINNQRSRQIPRRLRCRRRLPP
jgi:hypothetical protein